MPLLETRQFDKHQFEFFLSGDSPAYEFCVPTFRNTLFHLHNWRKQERVLKLPMKMEQTKLLRNVGT